MPGQRRRHERWLDEDSRKLGKTFWAGAAFGSAGSSFLCRSGIRTDAAGSAATATTSEAKADADAYTAATSKGRGR